MRGIWDSKFIPLKLKLRIYKTGVCSRLVYGSEGWILTPRTCAMINGANSRMLARITKRSVHDEARHDTQTFDVVASIRARHLQWVGHILRLQQPNRPQPQRMIHLALKLMHQRRTEGDLLADAPNVTWDELVHLASDKRNWRKRVHDVANGKVKPALKPHQCTRHRHAKSTFTVSMTPAPPMPSKSKYIQRDTHAAFFCPKLLPPANNTRSRKSKALTRTQLTDKQRRQWEREHYDMHHQFPTISGHHHPQQLPSPAASQHDLTLLPPPTITTVGYVF